MKLEKPGRIQWHPGFFGAAELEFRKNRKDLTFSTEVLLSKKSLQMDMLIVRKQEGTAVKNEIGALFKTYNIVEYKGPGDTLSLADFCKSIAYACLYKAQEDSSGAIPVNGITLTLIREAYPRKLLKELLRLGNRIERHFPGVYYVTGKILFDVQIVVISQPSSEGHIALRMLSQKAERTEIERFLKEASKYTEQSDKNNADAVLQVCASANPVLFEKIREDQIMCEALRNLMADELRSAEEKGRIEGLDAGREEGRAEGITQGRLEGILETLHNLVRDRLITVKQAADRAGMTPELFQETMKKMDTGM